MSRDSWHRECLSHLVKTIWVAEKELRKSTNVVQSPGKAFGRFSWHPLGCFNKKHDSKCLARQVVWTLTTPNTRQHQLFSNYLGKKKCFQQALSSVATDGLKLPQVRIPNEVLLVELLQGADEGEKYALDSWKCSSALMLSFCASAVRAGAESHCLLAGSSDSKVKTKGKIQNKANNISLFKKRHEL